MWYRMRVLEPSCNQKCLFVINTTLVLASERCLKSPTKLVCSYSALIFRSGAANLLPGRVLQAKPDFCNESGQSHGVLFQIPDRHIREGRTQTQVRLRELQCYECIQLQSILFIQWIFRLLPIIVFPLNVECFSTLNQVLLLLLLCVCAWPNFLLSFHSQQVVSEGGFFANRCWQGHSTIRIIFL